MHRSSESVAALASALAKAQAELINPEKSLTATIRTGRPGEGERSFRYAPLASGLDIVRKTLGQHEIATIQSTAIDRDAGVVNLTTMLAHASGEWIASDWPVCQVAETANPQRMGAALTYARRYALFTLVGIAGEDDLDAPDLCEVPPSSPTSRLPSRTPVNGRGCGLTKPSAIIDSEQSATLRDRLLAEIGELASAERAASWAQEALATKNKLAAPDAKLVGDTFEERLSALPSAGTSPSKYDGPAIAVRLTSLPRMADFALWAAACETALWPAGTFARAYDKNRKAAVEGIIELDPVAICVRKLMAQRGSWAGTASDLLCGITDLAGDDVWKRSAGWPKNPGALAGQLRRAQTFLRVLGIEIAFSREGRAGTRTIRICSSVENPPRPSAPSARSATTTRHAVHNSDSWGICRARDQC